MLHDCLVWALSTLTCILGFGEWRGDAASGESKAADRMDGPDLSCAGVEDGRWRKRLPRGRARAPPQQRPQLPHRYRPLRT